MRIKRKDANVVKICEASQVKVKTAGDTTVIQFCAGQNKKMSSAKFIQRYLFAQRNWGD